MTPTRFVAAVLAASLALAACGGLGNARDPGSSATPSPVGIDHATGPDDLLLRVEYEGGYVPADWYLKAMPTLSIFGDGTLVVPGPQIELYPGPALPNLQARVLSEEAIQRVLEAAIDAGLSGPDRSYDAAGRYIADAATTVFTVVADGARHQTRIYAFSEAPAGQDVPAEEREARQRLSDLLDRLTSLDSWLPEGSVGAEHEFQPTSLQLLVTDGAPATDENVKQRPVDWPLDQPLATFGGPVDGSEARCGVITGPDLGPVLDAARQASELSPWRSAGKMFGLSFRPLLPDEPGCPPRA